MRVFASRVLWNSLFRLVLFWGLVAGALFVLAAVTPYSNWQLVLDVLRQINPGSLSRLTGKDFAFALSSGIVQLALAIAFALFIAHVVLIRAALYAARFEFGRAPNVQALATRFDTVSQRVSHNAVVGPAWREFEKTTIRQDHAVYHTVRPQAYINIADLRERLFGLKIMGAIPGFFVGLGLLLTFIGLVIALNSAAGSTGAQSAEAMTRSLNELLEAATFKFSTSIAGLGASLALSLLFRSYQIWIDSSFYRLDRAIESRMLFHSSDQIAAESRDILAAQRDQLKEINSERFFSRLGDAVTPRIEGAISAAFRPITERLDGTMAQLTTTSQAGVSEMLEQFLGALRGGAGMELAQVCQSLDNVKGSLEAIQQSLAGSGADFVRRMTEVSDGVASIVAAARSGAAEVSERATREASDGTRAVVEAMKIGVDEVVSVLRQDIGGLSNSMQAITTALASHVSQITSATDRTRDAADALGNAARDVKSSTEPLLAHSNNVATSTERMATSIESSVGTLAETQATADIIAKHLDAHLSQIAQVWDQYEQRFRSVDEDFGKAADRFHEEVSRHQDSMRNFVAEIDRHTTDILQKLTSGTNAVAENVEALRETLDDFLQAMPSPKQAAI